MANPLHDIFIQEAEDNLGILEGSIIKIEEHPDDEHTINEAFRSIHSIKGGAGLAGFPEIKDFSHKLEDFFEYIRNRTITAKAEHISVILKSIDIIKMMIENIKKELDSSKGINSDTVLSEINDLIQNAKGNTNDPAGMKQIITEQFKESGRNYFFLALSYYSEIFSTGIDPVMYISDLQSSGDILKIGIDESLFPEIEDYDPEQLYLSWKLFYSTELNEKELLDIFCFVIDESEIKIIDLTDKLNDAEYLSRFEIGKDVITDFIPQQTENVRDTLPPPALVPAPTPAALNRSAEDLHEDRGQERRKTDRRTTERREMVPGTVSFIRVQTNKLENIFNTISELLISQARLNMLTEEHEDEIPEAFSLVTDSLKNITTILQEQITSLRMMSLGSTFDRFKRVVRDIAVERGKRVDLTISGHETELDKNMIEKLNDPLKHLVRNCIDHGIETEEERIKKGKEPGGKLNLAAYIENGKVIIEVSDDGSGIDRERILEKALEKELIPLDHQLTDGEILNLVFHPGLSTAEKVTDLSGRGVGMDVVQSSIVELHGNIEISSEEGKGTAFRLHLPLTLAILDGMVISTGKEKYIIPTLSILEIFRPDKGEVKTICTKGEAVSFRGDYIPMIRLHEIFDIRNAVEEPEKAELIVIYSGGMKAAILVDTVLDQFQIVLKSLQKNFRKVENISNATILGNGDVALIIDIQNLIQKKTTGIHV